MSKTTKSAEEIIKSEVQNEILAKLDEIIDNEIESMQEHYTIAEIASEVLLQINTIRGT